MTKKFSDFYAELGIDEMQLEKDMHYHRLLNKISAEIYDYRKAENLSQKELAEELGVKQAVISKIESGGVNFTIERLNNIAHALGGTLTVSLNLAQEVRSISLNKSVPASLVGWAILDSDDPYFDAA